MNSPWLYALTVGPLGFYLWTLALWHSSRHPKVVNGLTDFMMLAFGIGGVLAFGPFGQLLVRALSRRPDLIDWMVILSGMGLAGSLLAAALAAAPGRLPRRPRDVRPGGQGGPPLRRGPVRVRRWTASRTWASGKGIGSDVRPRLRAP